MTTNNFWKQKPLSEFSTEEWEAVCTRCGRCCQIKLQDEDDDAVYYTDLVCRYFNHTDGSCSEYEHRCTLVPSCLKLTPQNLDSLDWMPQDCAYRILRETGSLPDWHPLITGRPLAPEHSIRGKVVSEEGIPETLWEDHILEGGEDEL